jgi:hypothetical protein
MNAELEAWCRQQLEDWEAAVPPAGEGGSGLKPPNSTEDQGANGTLESNLRDTKVETGTQTANDLTSRIDSNPEMTLVVVATNDRGDRAIEVHLEGGGHRAMVWTAKGDSYDASEGETFQARGGRGHFIRSDNLLVVYGGLWINRQWALRHSANRRHAAQFDRLAAQFGSDCKRRRSIAARESRLAEREDLVIHDFATVVVDAHHEPGDDDFDCCDACRLLKPQPKLPALAH